MLNYQLDSSESSPSSEVSSSPSFSKGVSSSLSPSLLDTNAHSAAQTPPVSASPQNKKVKLSHYDSSSSSDTPLPRFKSPLCAQKPPSPVSFTYVSSVLSSAFHRAPVLPIDCFSSAICEFNTVSINFSTAPCPIPKHRHSSFSKFLQCYESLMAIRALNKLYAFSKDPKIQQIVKQRATLYRVERGDPRFSLAVEAISCNLFPIRVTVSLSDFESIFNIVYGIPFMEFFKCSSVADVLGGLRSPNVVVVNRKGLISVTVSPTWSSGYQRVKGSEWMEAVESETVERGDMERGRAGIFSGEGMRIAGFNIPRRLQIKGELRIPEKMNERWEYFMVSVNVDEQRSFFSDII